METPPHAPPAFGSANGLRGEYITETPPLIFFSFFFFCNMTLTIEKKNSGEFSPLFIRESLVSLSGATEELLSIKNRRGPSEAPNWSLVRRPHVALKVGSRRAAG